MSSNDRIFASGVAIKGVPGWWALHNWEPPTPPLKLTMKRTHSLASASAVVKAEAPKIHKEELNILSNSSGEYYEDLIVDESDDSIEPETDHEKDEEIEMEKEKDSFIVDVKAEIVQKEAVAAPPLAPSAHLKQQLLERLLMMDSSLLHDAIKKAKAKKIKMGEIDVVTGKKKKEVPLTLQKDEIQQLQLQHQQQSASSFNVPKECFDAIEPALTSLTKNLRMFPVIRASPYENDLLKKCCRVDFQENKTAARLRRKLLLRRQRRKMNFALFDLDHWMYLYLKSTEIALVFGTNTNTANANNTSNNHNNTNNSKNESLDSDKSPLTFSHTFDPQSIPYIVDPSRSLYIKLTGMASVYGKCPYPVTSPFTGKVLPEFIFEDDSSNNLGKLAVINELRLFMTEEEDSDYEDDDYSGVEYSAALKPSTFKSPKPCNSLPILYIKYTNLRKEFVGQLNDLLSESFWPGIDVSEALEYPDYAILALVGLSVVGCAICNPDGYLSYLYVRPDFQGHHIATKLLALLLPNLASRKDLTLHVSVSNAPALLLYQRIGFKPEEFVVNFYDKYLGLAEEQNTEIISNKNAFFMRLRR